MDIKYANNCIFNILKNVKSCADDLISYNAKHQLAIGIMNFYTYIKLKEHSNLFTERVMGKLRGHGAGDGNRTHVCSLGSCRSTIELHPPEGVTTRAI